jgi:opacity protein-like surface antigen
MRGEIMKKSLFCLICCFLLAFSSTGLAAETTGPYVSANIGWAMMADGNVSGPGFSEELEYDSGLTFGGALGNNFGNGRIEGEVAYQTNDIDTTGGDKRDDLETSLLSFMVNGYYDFHNDSAFTPYLTAGIGAAKFEIDQTGDPTEDDTVFAYQFGFGGEFAVSETVSLDCRYRYLGIADAELENKDEFEVASHNITLGVRVAF